MAHIILGTDDSVTTCDCCGKSNLKSTIIVSVDGEVMHYGSTCATRHTGMRHPEIARALQTVEANKIAAARAEFMKSTEYLQYTAKLHQAHRAKIQAGKAFMEYCSVECDAAESKQREIAAAHGLQAYQIHV